MSAQGVPVSQCVPVRPASTGTPIMPFVGSFSLYCPSVPVKSRVLGGTTQAGAAGVVFALTIGKTTGTPGHFGDCVACNDVFSVPVRPASTGTHWDTGTLGGVK